MGFRGKAESGSKNGLCRSGRLLVKLDGNSRRTFSRISAVFVEGSSKERGKKFLDETAGKRLWEMNFVGFRILTKSGMIFARKANDGCQMNGSVGFRHFSQFPHSHRAKRKAAMVRIG